MVEHSEVRLVNPRTRVAGPAGEIHHAMYLSVTTMRIARLEETAYDVVSDAHHEVEALVKSYSVRFRWTNRQGRDLPKGYNSITVAMCRHPAFSLTRIEA